MKIAIMQQNYVVGDLAGNARLIEAGYERLCARGAELVIGSELCFTGYPPHDLLERKAFIRRQVSVADALFEKVGNVPLIVGVARPNTSGVGKPLFNCAEFVQNAEVRGRKVKGLLPTYDVFDESRYFEPRFDLCMVDDIATLVCEDSWFALSTNMDGGRLYARDPVEQIVAAKPRLLVIINASPYSWGKGDVRFKLIADIARRVGCPVVYVNQVGGYDDLVFDGRSFAVDAEGNCIGVAKAFAEDELIIDLDEAGTVVYPSDTDNFEDLYAALVLS